MNQYTVWGIIVSLLASNAYSDAGNDTIDREHSVRKIVDSVGKIEDENISIADSFKHMFLDGKVSGQVRVVSAGMDPKETTKSTVYATAIGGILKYELAEFKGFNAGIAVYTSQDIDGLTGEDSRHNSELSSSAGSYAELAQSYINYNYEGFNARVGRQVLDTPLADSDDARVISNTFNAAVLSYSYHNVELMAGNIDSWQGTGAGLDSGWQKIGSHGVNFGGLIYNQTLQLSTWYYNITSQTNAIYLELGSSYDITNNVQTHAMLQYLHESELENSGIGASIYGLLLELFTYDIGWSVAYNKSAKIKGLQSFSGTGGGTLFTSMDTMTLDNIAQDREATALVAGITYKLNTFGFLYAYGDFIGNENSIGDKAHIVEQNIGFKYNINDELLVSAIYVTSQDKKSSLYTANDWQRAQLLVNYNF